jgi:RsiW-degrading membrane proteinase PrsW (M82 family)
MKQDYQGILKPNFVVRGRGEKHLSRTNAIVIGRDKSCQIILEETNPRYQGVSGRHAEIRPLATPASDGSPLWEICDLNSTNGTYVNGQRLSGCQTLQSGDKICLDRSGPEFIFELQSPEAGFNQTYQLPRQQPGNSLRISQFLPVISTGKDLLSKAYLIPAITTILLVVLLLVGGKEAVCQNALINPFQLATSCYNILLGTYLCLGGMYFTYLLCGKFKPWWVLVSSALITILILKSPILNLFIFLFRKILPGSIEDTNFITAFIGNFFGAGLMEELIKVIPLFVVLYLGRRLKSPWREKIGIWEPLDGILLGVASGVGFTYLETLGQYVNMPLDILFEEGLKSGACQVIGGELQCSEAIKEIIIARGQFEGLMLVIPRILGAVSGHAAWSGYLGYFIGLGILMPQRKWQLIGIGYLTVSAIHALWNSVSFLSNNQQLIIILQTLIGVLSYLFLIAAILKARQLSPTRSQNFATRVIGPNNRP